MFIINVLCLVTNHFYLHIMVEAFGGMFASNRQWCKYPVYVLGKFELFLAVPKVSVSVSIWFHVMNHPYQFVLSGVNCSGKTKLLVVLNQSKVV